MISCWNFLFPYSVEVNQVISHRILDACASWIPFHQIISSIDEITQIKENEIKEDPNEGGTGFKNADEEYQNATSECKPLPNSGDFRFWYPKLECVELSRLESGHFDLLIPKELLVGKKLHPLIQFLLFWEKMYKLQSYHMCDEVKMVSCLIFFILSQYKTRG